MSMRIVLLTVFLVAVVRCALSSVMPLSAKEIGLMLRSGYSSETILRELSSRRFGDQFDSEIEKQLISAGANSTLIEALRSGAYALPSSAIAAAKTKLAAQEGNATKTLKNPNETGRLTESHSATDPSGSSSATEVNHAIYLHLKDDLVYWHQGSVTHFDDEALEHKKLYLLFFSANWSAAGRKFTSQLVEYYNRVGPQHPEFEVIFFSADRSQFGMETYMAQSNMPWPAVGYDKLAGKAGAIQNNLMREIPSLVLADAAGKVLSYSHGGENAVGPEKILGDLDEIFRRGSDSAAAQKP
jgi:nucleoredoxin